MITTVTGPLGQIRLPVRPPRNPPELERFFDLPAEARDTLAALFAQHEDCACDFCTPDPADPIIYSGVLQDLRPEKEGLLFMLDQVRMNVESSMYPYKPRRISFRRRAGT